MDILPFFPPWNPFCESQAEEYDEGGQGVAYYDTNTANNGGDVSTTRPDNIKQDPPFIRSGRQHDG